MNRICLILIIVLLMCITSVAWAQTSKNEAILNKSAALLDKEASRPGGEKVVAQKLEKEFNVDAARIDSLRDSKLGYGETAIVLSMAKKLPGGITDANVNRIVSMRQGPPVQGWGKTSKKLGFKLGPVISSVKKMRLVSR
jgi:cell division protein FtsL